MPINCLGNAKSPGPLFWSACWILAQSFSWLHGSVVTNKSSNLRTWVQVPGLTLFHNNSGYFRQNLHLYRAIATLRLKVVMAIVNCLPETCTRVFPLQTIGTKYNSAYYALCIHNMALFVGEDTGTFFETVYIVINCVLNLFRVFCCTNTTFLLLNRRYFTNETWQIILMASSYHIYGNI